MRVIKYVCIVVLMQYALMVVSFTEARALGWPRTLKHEKGTLTFYQPQFERWGDEVIEGQVAMIIQLHGSSAPIAGGVWLKADTDVSLMDNLVQLSNIQVSNIRIPSVEPQAAENARQIINDTLAGQTQILSLGRILPAFLDKIDAEWVKTIQPNLDPPHIWVSLEPAVLLTLEGEEPILQPIADTGLQIVLNTNMDAFYYPDSGTYYLFTGEQWLSFSPQADEWKGVETLPEVFKQIPDDHERAYIKDLLDAKSDKGVKVFISPPPAALIQLDDQPKLEEISGTSLSYVTNTDQHLFFHNHEKLWYVMLSGRWFRTKNFQDSWLAATTDLPGDFQQIPLNHPKSVVLFSVPGSNIAKELVLQTQIPQRVTVDRSTTTAAVVYRGEPHFVPIQNTSIKYAVNTRNDVFQIKNTYYLCFEGIWFSSDRPDENWKIFTAVPKEIYAIPESHPKYYVTFVKVYDSKAKTATFGFTSGYMGLYATNLGTAVYGTGYYTPSYLSHDGGMTYYYPNPATYRAWTHQYNLLRVKTLDRYSPDIYGHYTYYYSVYAANYQDEKSFQQVSQLFEALRPPYDSWGDTVVSRSGDWVQTVDQAELQQVESQVGEVQEQDNNVYLSENGKIFRHNENGWATYENGTWVPYFSDQLPSLPENERNTQMDGYIAALKRQRGSEPAPPPTTPYQVTPPATSSRSTSRRAPAAAPSQPVQVNVNVQNTQQSRGYYYGPKPPHQLVITPGGTPFGPTVQKEVIYTN